MLVRMAESWPSPPKTFSKFQRERLRKSFEVVDLYLDRGMTVSEIAKRRHCTHQMISLILKLGIDYLLETGTIRVIEELAA
jgi:hypothetical protein